MARVVPPEISLAKLQPVLDRVGITRVANLTGLDRVGIPVVAVIRPNSRSYSVAQGKGLTLAAAKVSGIMESIENHHAEGVSLSLRHGRHSELRRAFLLADVAGLPRLANSVFHESQPLLWAEGGFDLITGAPTLLPYELVHLDFRHPLGDGGKCFFMSSNGLASGNHFLEATSHALSELIERDANTLFQLSSAGEKRRRRLDLATVDDPACGDLLRRFDDAGIDVLAWDTTTDVRVASVLCEVVDRDPDMGRPMPPVPGSGCHPLRRIALSRALTEAAQGRLTRISGSRDDLSNRAFDEALARRLTDETRALFREEACTAFSDLPNAEHETLEEDVRHICAALRATGLQQILALNLSDPALNIPVVRVVVPYLEAMSEVPGYVPGARARRVLERRM